jgi:hypothetical protein
VRADVVIYSAVRVYEASMRVDFRTHRSLPRTPHPTEGPDAGGTTHTSQLGGGDDFIKIMLNSYDV